MLNLLGLYEKALPKSMSWVEKLLTAKQLGFDFVEISVDESEERLSRLDWSMQQRAELSKIIESVQVPILSMCFSGHRKYPLAAVIHWCGKHHWNLWRKRLTLPRGWEFV